MRRASFLTCLLLLGLASKLRAVPENDYETHHRTKVLPFVFNKGTAGTIETEDGETIAYKYYKHPESQKNLVILQGWTEHYEGWGEFAYDLYQKKMSIFLFDWRGQGLSSRPLKDSYRSHVEDFQVYFQDLDAMLKKVIRPQSSGPLMALGFSMGANILSLYQNQHPDTFEGIILVSPMLDVKTSPFPQWFVWFVARTMKALGQGEEYVWGHGPFDGTTTNLASSSEIRFEKWRQLRSAFPERVINGVSWSWLLASLEATWKMRDEAGSLHTPMLMLQAGKDRFVNTGGQDYLCQKSNDCDKFEFPNAMHAILAEKDAIRDQALAKIIDFIEKDR